MIELVRGVAFGMRKSGVACRFITVDTDIINNPTVGFTGAGLCCDVGA